MITWLDEPYAARLESGFECLIHGWLTTPMRPLEALVVDEEGRFGLVSFADVITGWRYDRIKRRWTGADDPTGD